MFNIGKILVLSGLICCLAGIVRAADVNAIERFYSREGSLKAVMVRYPAHDRKLKMFTVAYPEITPGSTAKYPMVVFCNGTLMPVRNYQGVLRYLATWGFVAVGSEENYSGSGAGTIALLKFMQQLDADKNSVLYNRIDWQNIGIAGHSQGGVAAFNTVTRYPEGALFKAVFTMSCCRRSLAAAWPMSAPYDPSEVKVPVMMTASANPKGMDDPGGKLSAIGIAPLQSMQENRMLLRKNSPCVVIGRISSDKCNHANTFGESLPYLTAWFVYHLQNNSAAGKFFTGKNPELLRNPRWQDVFIDWNQPAAR